MTLKGEVCCLYSHGSFWPRHAQPEIGIVEHLNRQVDGFRPEVDHQHLALEISLLVGIHLDALSTAVDFLGDDTAFRERIANLFKGRIQRD